MGHAFDVARCYRLGGRLKIRYHSYLVANARSSLRCCRPKPISEGSLNLNSTRLPNAAAQVPVFLGVAGLLVGIIVTMSFLTADELGRVNLLYLLLLFAVLPILGLLLSLVFLLRKSSIGLAGWLLELRLWPSHWHGQIFSLGDSDVRRAWFFYQSQLLGLALGCGGLLAFLILLLGSDVSFVWRSTLLEATDILPALNLLALPWSFWSEARASLELLQGSQEFRLAGENESGLDLGQWWKYAFAAQCTYNLIPRALMLLFARSAYLRKSTAEQLVTASITTAAQSNSTPHEATLSIVSDALAAPYALLDWAQLPTLCRGDVEAAIGKPGVTLHAGPLSALSLDQLKSLEGQELVVLVKSWEPPMGELRDFLESLPQAGFVFPLDWHESKLRAVKASHLTEWRRFCATIDGWVVLQPGGLI